MFGSAHMVFFSSVVEAAEVNKAKQAEATEVNIAELTMTAEVILAEPMCLSNIKRDHSGVQAS
jgi:hypothetical protein